MRTLKMPEVNSTLRGSPLSVPGGWLAQVPAISGIDEAMRTRLANYYQAARYLTPLRAEEVALERVQLALDSAYKKAFGDGIRHYAKVYAQTYPHLWNQETGELKGFDAAELVMFCLPHEESPGRKGRSALRAAMRRMAEAEAHASIY